MLNKVNIMKKIGIGMLSLFLLGCSDDQFLLTDETLETKEESVIPDVNAAETSSEMINVKENESEKSSSSDIPISAEPMLIAVHVCGAVKEPGVYFLEEGTRIVDAICMAGGFCEEADEDYVNQALLLQDGVKVYIPTKEEVESRVVKMEDKEALYGMQTEASGAGETGKININTADVAMLCTLPGIGESRANSIIAYRDANGPFEKIEDIMKVSGIKEAAFEKIKDKIIVSR